MIYFLIILLCGLPLSQFIFRGIDIWHAQGFWFQAGTLVCYCASFYFEPNKVRIRNIPLGLITLWFGILTFHIFYKGLIIGKYLFPSVLCFLNFLTILIFYQLCVQYLDKIAIEIILKLYACLILITLFYCVIQAFKLDPLHKLFFLPYYSTVFHNPAVVGFIGNPTHLSAYLGSVLPILFVLKNRTTVLSVILLFVIILFFTNYASNTVPTTGAVVAILTLLYYLFKVKSKWFWRVITILTIGLIIFWSFAGTQIKRELLADQSRTHWWGFYWNLIKQNFIKGYGLGAVWVVAPQTPWKEINHLHNEYLQVIFEAGIIGLCSVIYCIYDFFKLKVKEDKLVVILKTVIIGFLVQSFTLYPAHLWLTTSILIFCYASMYVIKNEEFMSISGGVISEP